MFESSFFLSFVGFFLVLTPLVFVHEFGHYYAAIKSGVKVETFSIGFGPELLGFNDNKNTRWKFSLIPLGGYVKMKGELINLNDNSNKNSLEKDSFLQASLLSRFLIVGSGPLANLLLGLLLITSLYALNAAAWKTSSIFYCGCCTTCSRRMKTCGSRSNTRPNTMIGRGGCNGG